MQWFPRVADEFNKRYANRRVSVVTTPDLGPGYVPDSEGVCVRFFQSQSRHWFMELDNGFKYQLIFDEVPGPENVMTGCVDLLLPNRRVFTFSE